MMKAIESDDNKWRHADKIENTIWLSAMISNGDITNIDDSYW